MKGPQLFLALISMSVFFLASCSDNNPATEDSQESSESEKFDQNIFGHGLDRGLIQNSEKADPGYIMFCPTNSAETYLVNREGEVVHIWKGNYAVEGAYLGDDGSIVQNVADVDFPTFAGGGESGRIQKLDWDSRMLWDFEYANEEYHSHHDFAVMPNGNILTIAWEAKSYEECIQAGRKPELTPKSGLWPDKIVEIKPLDKYHGEVIWEWHIWDHLVQNYDATKDNYGNPSDHPGLMDLNLGNELPEPISQDSMETLHKNGDAWRNRTVDNRGSDMYHSNAINYNAELDQIAMSVRQLSEIIIIDHSTTTQEAAGHTGGSRGKGGDFLFRWGNPENYGRGDSTDQRLYHQHDIRWIEQGKPGAGNLTVFNNDIPGGRDSMNYSAVLEFTTPMDASGNYILEEGKSYSPEPPVWKYIAPDSVTFYAPFVSGAQRMKNGNTLVNVGPRGHFFEVTPEGEKIWEYLMPYRGNIHEPNGDPKSPMPFTHLQFRATFIPTDHPGLAGRDLTPVDPQPDVFHMPPPPDDTKG